MKFEIRNGEPMVRYRRRSRWWPDGAWAPVLQSSKNKHYFYKLGSKPLWDNHYLPKEDYPELDRLFAELEEK